MKKVHGNDDQIGESSREENDEISKKFEANEINESQRIVNEEYDENSLQKNTENALDPGILESQQDNAGIDTFKENQQQETDFNGKSYSRDADDEGEDEDEEKEN